MSHKPHGPVPVISYNGNLILAAAQTTANLPAMKLKGWTDAETQTFTTLKGVVP